MNNFSLSSPPITNQPTEITGSDGGVYRIDPCFRVVLACLRDLSNPDMPDVQKMIRLAARFFLNRPPPAMDKAFAYFVVGEEPDDDQSEPMMDFELDAGVIYASFRHQYDIDLLVEDLHWYIFRILLAGLGEDTAFGARVRLRGIDPAEVAQKDRAKLRKLKDMVAIKPKTSKAEQELNDELNRVLADGGDPTDIIRRLQEV